MNLKGKQLKRVRRYRSASKSSKECAWVTEAGPFTQEQWNKLKTRVKKGMTFNFSMSKQMTQPMPQTIDIAAWGKEFDAMALCNIFGVPYEVYQGSQTDKL